MKTTLANDVLFSLRSILGESPVSLHEPLFSGNEYKYLKNCLDSTMVSSIGSYVDQFESELASFTGAKYAIAVMNGTAALHMSLILVGVKKGDEVLIPSMSFVATANAVSYAGAVPHFVSSNESTLGIDVESLRSYLLMCSYQSSGKCINRSTGRTIRAIVPMHTFGHPSDMDGLLAIERDFNITLVEDAAESLGSTYEGRHVGTFGKIGALSFNGNKIITTGGGGALLTNDLDTAKRAKHLTTTAKVTHAWSFYHDQIGYNYRLPNINAALGCAQLERLPEFLKAKKDLYAIYHNAFSKFDEFYLKGDNVKSKGNYWLHTLILREQYSSQQKEILMVTNEAGITTRPVWELLHTLPMYRNCPSMEMERLSELSKRVINIPSSPKIVIK